MDAQTLMLDGRLNLSRASILLLDNQLGIEVLTQILAGFQASRFHRCNTVAKAKLVAEDTRLDLVIAEVQLRNGEPGGCDFVHWLRRSNLEPNAYVPTILVSAHTSVSNVVRARDCGANLLVAKPLSPAVMLERVLWVAKENRPFVVSDAYVGPERRYHDLGPLEGHDDRRHGPHPEADHAPQPLKAVS